MPDVLRFGRNKRFRIMLVSDVHETADCDSRHDMEVISDYLTLQNRALTTLKPNLVVLMGDTVYAKDAEAYKQTVERILSPFKSRNVPVAVVLGHSEYKSEVSKEEQIQIWKSFEICKYLADDSRSDEYGDYNLLVHGYNNDKPLLNLWFMDISRPAEEKYNSKVPFATNEQIKWYEATAEELKKANGGESLPALLFQHVPVPEEYHLLKTTFPFAFFGKAVKSTQPSRKGKYYLPDKEDTDISGHLGEAPKVPDFNNGQFASWKKTGDVKGAFFGQDHMNDFIGTVNGIVLAQCKLAGFRPYGDGLQQGVRIVDVYEDSPSEFKSRMCYYRDIIGTNSISTKGFKKWMRDSYSVTFYNSLRLLGVAAAITGTIIATRKYTENVVVVKKAKKK